MNTEYFRKKIKLLRKKNNLTKLQIANALGIKLMTYTAIEQDGTNITDDIINKLAKIYLLTTENLIDPTPEEEYEVKNATENIFFTKFFDDDTRTRYVLSDVDNRIFSPDFNQTDGSDSVKIEPEINATTNPPPARLRDLQSAEQDLILRYRLLALEEKQELFRCLDNIVLTKENKKTDK